MKYFLLVLTIIIGYVYYEYSRPWNDNDLAVLVTEKSEDLCVMPELLTQYKITSAQCETTFEKSLQGCLEETEQNYPGETFTSKKELLTAFNQSLSCIVMQMNPTSVSE